MSTKNINKKDQPLEIIEIPSDYRPSEDEEFMNSTMVAYFKLKLINWRQEFAKRSRPYY